MKKPGPPTKPLPPPTGPSNPGHIHRTIKPTARGTSSRATRRRKINMPTPIVFVDFASEISCETRLETSNRIGARKHATAGICRTSREALKRSADANKKAEDGISGRKYQMTRCWIRLFVACELELGEVTASKVGDTTKANSDATPAPPAPQKTRPRPSTASSNRRHSRYLRERLDNQDLVVARSAVWLAARKRRSGGRPTL